MSDTFAYSAPYQKSFLRFAYPRLKIWRSNTVKIQTLPFIYAYHYSLAMFNYSIEAFKPSLTTSTSGVLNALTTFKYNSKHSMNQVKHWKQACKINLQPSDMHFKQAVIQFQLLFWTFDFRFDIPFKHSIIQLQHSM